MRLVFSSRTASSSKSVKRQLLVRRWIMCSFDRLIDWLLAWLLDWLIDWWIDWLIVWLFDWLIDWVSLCCLLQTKASLFIFNPYFQRSHQHRTISPSRPRFTAARTTPGPCFIASSIDQSSEQMKFRLICRLRPILPPLRLRITQPLTGPTTKHHPQNRRHPLWEQQSPLPQSRNWRTSLRKRHGRILTLRRYSLMPQCMKECLFYCTASSSLLAVIARLSRQGNSFFWQTKGSITIRLIDWLIDLPFDWLIDWFTVWLIDWLIAQTNIVYCSVAPEESPCASWRRAERHIYLEFRFIPCFSEIGPRGGWNLPVLVQLFEQQWWFSKCRYQLHWTCRYKRHRYEWSAWSRRFTTVVFKHWRNAIRLHWYRTKYTIRNVKIIKHPVKISNELMKFYIVSSIMHQI